MKKYHHKSIRSAKAPKNALWPPHRHSDLNVSCGRCLEPKICNFDGYCFCGDIKTILHNEIVWGLIYHPPITKIANFLTFLHFSRARVFLSTFVKRLRIGHT